MFDKFRKPKSRKPVGMADLSSHMEAAAPNAPVVGLDAEGQAVSLDLEEAGNVALSSGAGGGKSSFLRLLIAQTLHHGGRVVICDAKRVSQRWCADLEGVTYAKDGAQIAQALADVRAEMKERQTDLSADHPRLLVVLEEQNLIMRKLREHQNTTDGNSTALWTYTGLVANGPLVNINVVSVGHLFTVESLGGSRETLNHYGARLFARMTRNGQRMLASEVEPVKGIGQRGTFHRLATDTWTWSEYRGGLISDEEARAWAAGVRA